MKTLKEYLADWTDFDGACWALGVVIGQFPPESEMSDFKGVFWSRNDLGEGLFSALESLVKAGLLEFEEEECRFRWREP